MELEATWGRSLRVWLAYLWRKLVAIIAGIILGVVLNFILGAVGVAPGIISRIMFLIGAVVGIGVSFTPIRLILNKDFGEFRLVLVANSPQVASVA